MFPCSFQPRPSFRRKVLYRRDVNSHLLPPNLSGTPCSSPQHEILRVCSGSGVSRIPTLSSLFSGVFAQVRCSSRWSRNNRLCSPPHFGWSDRRTGCIRRRRKIGNQRQAPSAAVCGALRGIAVGIRTDAKTPVCKAAHHGHRIDDDEGSFCIWISNDTTIQWSI